MRIVSRLYGLTVAAPFPLGHAVPPGEEVDLVIEVAAQREFSYDSEAPTGRLIAWEGEPVPYFSLLERPMGRGYAYRVRDVVDVEISPDLRHVRCHLLPGGEPAMLPVLVSGNLLASLLLLEGHSVLHASAVEIDGEAVALVGRPRSGKSSLAALSCRAGAHLVTDDVLRIETGGEGASCYRGGPSLRLRPTVRSTTPVIDEARAVSADGRHLLDPPATALDRLPLRAFYFPEAVDAEPLVRTQLAPKAALVALLARPRVLNWSDARTAGRHFAEVAALVNGVPCYSLAIRPGILPDEDVATGGEWPKRIVDALFA